MQMHGHDFSEHAEALDSLAATMEQTLTRLSNQAQRMEMAMQTLVDNHIQQQDVIQAIELRKAAFARCSKFGTLELVGTKHSTGSVYTST